MGGELKRSILIKSIKNNLLDCEDISAGEDNCVILCPKTPHSLISFNDISILAIAEFREGVVVRLQPDPLSGALLKHGGG